MDESGYFVASIAIQSVTLLVLVGTLIFFGLQWWRNRSEASVRMRPYLGLDEMIHRDIQEDNNMEFDTWILNYGNIPAVNATMYGEFVVQNGEKAKFTCETKGAVFPYAKTPERWKVGVKDIDKKDILSGKKVLIINHTIEYYSTTGKKYMTKYNRTFNPKEEKEKSWVDVNCELT